MFGPHQRNQDKNSGALRLSAPLVVSSGPLAALKAASTLCGLAAGRP